MQKTSHGAGSERLLSFGSQLKSMSGGESARSHRTFQTVSSRRKTVRRLTSFLYGRGNDDIP